jgi:hypothetical protein
MNFKFTYLLPCGLLLASVAFAGNPDRQGEAGAAQLLINPWARSAGLHSMNTSNVSGADAMFLNVAGLSRINKTQIQIGHARYLEGADVGINALGFAQKIGKGGGSIGVSLMAIDMGDIPLTTTDIPEGSGATFSPSIFNLGVSYSHMFENRVSVGITTKFVNESISNASASAIAVDAGVQYVTGEQDNFKFGISLRNVGSKMQFTGEGLAQARPNPGTTFEYPITYYTRTAAYELPSQLNIGASYDFLMARSSRLTVVGNFTSNAFSRDQVGGGLEFALGKNFAFRAGYKGEFDQNDVEQSLDNGVSAGFSASTALKKGSDSRLSIDYSFRSTSIYRGIHNIGVRLDL